MNIVIEKMKTMPEQVYQNTKDIEEIKKNVDPTLSEKVTQLTESVETLEGDFDKFKDKLDDIDSEVDDIKDKVQDIDTDVAKHDADIAQIKTDLAQTWEKEFLDVEIKPEQFNENKEVTIENEIYKIANYITITAEPDNGDDVVNNSKNIASCGLVPLSQTVDGSITLRADKLPESSLFLRIIIEIQLEVL